MQQVHRDNLNKRAYFGFYIVGIVCGVLAAALIVHAALTYESGVASAYVSNRSFSVLKVAPRESMASEFMFYIGAWCLGAVLLLYLSCRFIQLARRIGAELRTLPVESAAPRPCVKRTHPGRRGHGAHVER